MNISSSKLIIFFTVFSLIFSCNKTFDQSGLIEEVTFTNKKDNAQLAGTLTLPIAKGKFNAVVLISGSGLQDRDETAYGHKTFKVLAEYLTSQNIAVLRYDDRGAGESIGPLTNVTPENFAEDAYAAVKYLQSRTDIINYKIGLIGHSMGAVESCILASRYNDISFLVMLAGPGLPLDINMLKADSLNSVRSGKSKDEVSAGQKLLKSMINEVKNGPDKAELENSLNSIIADWQDSLSGSVKDAIKIFTKKHPDHWRKMASEWSTPYYRYVLNFDPYPVLKDIRCPLLSVIGEKDVQVPAEENSMRIKQALVNGHCPDYRVEVLKNLNHLFLDCETGAINEYAKINGSFNKNAMQLIANWINEQ